MTTSVLIVDDDPQVRSLLTSVFSDEGFMVTACADGQEALANLEPEPDLIILDVAMPVMDGREFLREYRAAGHCAPVLVLSADAASAVGAEFAVPAMNKPFDLELLLVVADRLTEHQAA